MAREALTVSDTQPPIPATLNCSTITGPAPSRLSALMSVGKDIGVMASSSTLAAAGNSIGVVLDIVETIRAGPSTTDEINELKAELDCMEQSLDWKMLAIAYNDNQWAPVVSALNEALSVGITRGSPYDANAATGVTAAGGFTMFERTFVESSTDANVDCGGESNGQCNWKSIISSHEPDLFDSNQVFDWRMALPWFTQLIANRLMIIALEDPNYGTDGLWNYELEYGTALGPGYRAVLQSRLQQMINGIRCSTVPNYQDWLDGGDYMDQGVACADVNTGLSIGTWFWPPAADEAQCSHSVWNGTEVDQVCLGNVGTADAPPYEDKLRRSLLAQMPIFQTQSMIDALAHITHPGPDLTESLGRIRASANANLCLAVQGGNTAEGTPVVLATCDGGPAQQWHYNRQAQTIVNTAYNKCLQADPSSTQFVPGTRLPFNTPGTLAQIGACNSSFPRQKWSYDPEGGLIRNALGTVLDIKWNNQQPGTTVWLWDYDGQSAQQWYADPTSAYCNSTCSSSCPSGCIGNCTSSCSSAGANEGSCIGACMGSCVGACMPSCLQSCL